MLAECAEDDSHPVAARLSDRAEETVDRRTLTARFAERTRGDVIMFDHQFSI